MRSQAGRVLGQNQARYARQCAGRRRPQRTGIYIILYIVQKKLKHEADLIEDFLRKIDRKKGALKQQQQQMKDKLGEMKLSRNQASNRDFDDFSKAAQE